MGGSRKLTVKHIFSLQICYSGRGYIVVPLYPTTPDVGGEIVTVPVSRSDNGGKSTGGTPHTHSGERKIVKLPVSEALLF